MITDIKPWLWFNLIELIALVFTNGLKCRNKCEVISIRYFCFPTGLFTPNGDRLISGSSDRTIKIWDVFTGTYLGTLQGHSHWVASLALSQDAKILISGSWDETIRCWDIPTGQCLQTLRSLLPYKGMIIDDVINLTEAEIVSLKALGAIAICQ